MLITIHPSTARDARVTAEIHEDGTPWPIYVHFVRLEDATGEVELRHVGFEIGERFDDVQDGDEGDPRPLDPVTVNRVVGHYLDYVEIAQRALTVEIGGLGAAIKRLRGPGAKPARLTDDFYRLIASDYRQRSESGVSAPLQSLADAHHADKSTASRWIKEARRRGYLDDTKGRT